MPNQSFQQATQELKMTPLGPEVRKIRERELGKLRSREVKQFQKRLNDRLARAKEGYQSVNKAQAELDDEYEALAAQEGRLSAREYRAKLEELNQRQSRLEQQRSRHRTELVGVGEAIDELEEDPDSVIDDFYDRHHALPRPTAELSW